ncbi:glycosyltransferase family 2 protein, partial [candidate division KSB1 bacterium]|nr:glycosyltransferase family 2 protein [candidate division KSB1 bacterium]
MKTENATSIADQNNTGGAGILFSVVICTHNRAGMLDRVLQSVLLNQQEKGSYEILVVDNASSDNTSEIIEPYTKEGVVRYLEDSELGLSNARNTGLLNSNGKYVVYLDDDAEVTETWLESFHHVFQNYPNCAVCGGRVIPCYEIPKPDWVTGISDVHSQGFHPADKIIAHNWAPGGNSAWDRSILLSLNGFDSRLGRKGSKPLRGSEESELVTRAIEQGFGVYYNPHAFMYHHISKDRISLSYMGWLHYGHGGTGFRWMIITKKSIRLRTL